MNADIEHVAAQVARDLNGRSVGCAESITAGRIAACLACVEHAADFFRGGVVAYQTAIKRTLLGVDAPNVLSEEAACQMASGVSHLLGVDAAVATTGLAGGDAEPGIPVGTVFVGTVVDGVTSAHRYWFDGNPEQVCDAATKQSLIDLGTALARAKPGHVSTTVATNVSTASDSDIGSHRANC
ncbi:MAG: CinA family protein [Acidimicrobiia bacterium]